MSKIANYLGKTILVSMPKLNGDEQPRPFKLVGVECCGLWLEDEGRVAFAPPDGYPPQAAMVPFAHIAYVLCGAAHQAAGPRQDPREKTMKPAVKPREKEEKHNHQIKRKR